jgi:hypothetical protein
MRMRAMTTTMVAMVVLATAGGAGADNRGVQITPDGKRVLVNKDVGTERWAITLNENGSATGNVFRSDGGPPAFVFCAPTGAPNSFVCSGADACTDQSGAQRGIQGVPDETRVLVQKDVGTERWAISQNFDDGTATGNIFRADGGDPAFVVCTPTGAPNGYSCSGADKCLAAPCENQFTLIGEVTLPESFFALPDPCNEDYVNLGPVTLPPTFFVPPTPVNFFVSASAPVQAFQLRVFYSTADGSFDGGAENVDCTSSGGGIFTKNDNDTGTLTLSVADTTNLALPLQIRCGFNALGEFSEDDLTVTVQEVTQNNLPGDPSVLSVDVSNGL